MSRSRNVSRSLSRFFWLVSSRYCQLLPLVPVYWLCKTVHPVNEGYPSYGMPRGSLHYTYVQNVNKANPNTREEMRLRVMRLLDAEPKLSQREIADRLGVSLGSVNYCLKALIEKGWLKVNNFRRSDNKLGYAYILTARGVRERAFQTKRFLIKKLDEYEQLKVEIASLEAEVTENTLVDVESSIAKVK